ncbi:MAG: MBL fold metallo-hydrolase [Phaeodactylibacter sp.]|nr:MBL fold metallo-hydrolase [Phaeodactylibacter sp.]MCB9276737.1 MBL fold metallo-hydrolase [Lewinellaceae bacterium]
MKIQFCGAAREVTGSAHLITLKDGFKILLDCGLYQGSSDEMEDFNESWYFKPEEIDVLLLSHAHIDHSGRIPKLVKDGFYGPIHCTHATRSLCAIMLVDSAKIQEMDAHYHNKRQHKHGNHDNLRKPLYTVKDVEKAWNLFEGHGYGRWFRIHKDVEVLYRDAGHILGSASVTLRIQEEGRTIMFGFTGDVGRPNRPILRDPELMPEVDYLICESTYGDRDHDNAPNELNRFLDIIYQTCIEQGGKLIIPAFSVGRTQEIVYMLDQLENAGKLPRRIPVYVDSPLAVNATTIFGAHPECFDDELNEYLLTDDNPFGFNGLTYVRNAEISKGLNTSKEPCIIISSSGMMNAGRVKHHLFHNIENPANTFLMVGYCAPETPGGALRDGAKHLRVFGEEKVVKARIEIMDSFSAHAGQHELADFLANQKGALKQLFLVHGTLDKQEIFSSLLQEQGFKPAEIPVLGQEYEL